ncbi:hypothetical protein AB0E69_13450 [Kribbella sp. NPDC026611]|uniref:hypothetical protein n=1 Tax=Kribbella sp. NPDC026611 TaxID=3154911 RepID=UPI0033F49E9C
MGQFSKYVEHAAPSPRAVRAVQVLLPVVWIAKAASTRSMGDIALAASFTLFILPAGIAPTRYKSFLNRLNAHPLAGNCFMFVILTAMLFGVLTNVLHPLPSLATAAAATLVVLALTAALRRRRNPNSAGTTNSPRPPGPRGVR